MSIRRVGRPRRLPVATLRGAALHRRRRREARGRRDLRKPLERPRETKLSEQRINSPTLEKDFERRLQLAKGAEWQMLSEGERRRRAIRNHLVERILMLACLPSLLRAGLPQLRRLLRAHLFPRQCPLLRPLLRLLPRGVR